MEPCDADRIANWSRHVRAGQLLRTAAAALGADTQIMPLKGVLLAALGILDPAARPIRDVDVLVRGLGLTRIVHRLANGGFALTDVAQAYGYLSFVHPDQRDLLLDVHVLLVPPGLGRSTRFDLFRGATLDQSLFETPVYVPARNKLPLHTIMNVIKDHVVDAVPHNATDLAAQLAGSTPQDLAQLAAELRALSLRSAGALALTWTQTYVESCAMEQLLVLLEPDENARRRLSERLVYLERTEGRNLRSRVRGRAVADDWRLRLLAPIQGAVDVASWPLRKRWLEYVERAASRG